MTYTPGTNLLRRSITPILTFPHRGGRDIDLAPMRGRVRETVDFPGHTFELSADLVGRNGNFHLALERRHDVFGEPLQLL